MAVCKFLDNLSLLTHKIIAFKPMCFYFDIKVYTFFLITKFSVVYCDKFLFLHSAYLRCEDLSLHVIFCRATLSLRYYILLMRRAGLSLNPPCYGTHVCLVNRWWLHCASSVENLKNTTLGRMWQKHYYENICFVLNSCSYAGAAKPHRVSPFP